MVREEEKVFAGTLFSPGDPDLVAIKLRSHNLSQEYNQTWEEETEKRTQLLKDILAEAGDGMRVQGPIFFHYGKHTKIGKNFFANYDLTVQDDALVTIGDNCNFGPKVMIVTPVHPMVPEERRSMKGGDGSVKHLCYAKPVHIGDDCWLGAGVIVCPGVTIGEGCVIGAGSVVTKDVPPRSFAAGVPCRVIREITEADSMIHTPELLGDNLPFTEEELKAMQ